MDKKAGNLNRYKRMFQLTDDFSWVTKYAQEKVKEKKKPYTFPSIRLFLNTLVSANKNEFEANSTQGTLGLLMAEVLVNHYSETVDLKAPALKSIEIQSDIEAGMASELFEFSPEDKAKLKSKVIEKIEQLGDYHLSKHSVKFNDKSLNNLINFALSRAYVDTYWYFVYMNPIVTLLLENQKSPLSIRSSLTKKIITAAEGDDGDYVGRIKEVDQYDDLQQNESGDLDFESEEDDEASAFLAKLERQREEEQEIAERVEVTQDEAGEDELYAPSVNKVEELVGRKKKSRKRHSKITDFTGKKIRISQLIHAYKISRAKWAVQLLKDAGDTPAYRGYMNCDADIEHLERVFSALKEFSAEHPNNKFFTWHGQRIGDGDVYVISTTSSFKTMNSLIPPTFITSHQKKKYRDPDTGELVDKLSHLNLNIEYTDLDGTRRQLGPLLPDRKEVFKKFVQGKFQTDDAQNEYGARVSQNIVSDLRNLHEFNIQNQDLHNTAHSLMKLVKGGARDTLLKFVLFQPGSKSPTSDLVMSGRSKDQLKEPELTDVCNLIWREAHAVIANVLNDHDDSFSLNFDLKALPGKLVDAVISNEQVSPYLRDLSESRLEVALNQLLEEMEIPLNSDNLRHGFISLSKVVAPASLEKSKQTQIKKFKKSEMGQRAFAFIQDRLDILVAQIDQDVGFIPGQGRPRDYKEYQGVITNFTVLINERFKDFLLDQSAIRLIIKQTINRRYPDVLKQDIEHLWWYGGSQGAGKSHSNAKQVDMLKNIFSGGYYKQELSEADQEFIESQESLSNRNQLLGLYSEVEESYSLLKGQEKDLNIDGTPKDLKASLRWWPTEVDQNVLDEIVQHLFAKAEEKSGNLINPDSAEGREIEMNAGGHAMVETMRRWLALAIGPDEDRTQNIRVLLGRDGANHSVQMGMFANIGEILVNSLSDDIAKNLAHKFPSGGKHRGVITTDFLAQQQAILDDKVAEIIGKRVPDTDEDDDEVSPHEQRMTELDINAREFASAKEGSANEGGANIKLNIAAAEAETLKFTKDLQKNIFRTVRTRSTSSETFEEAKTKPRIALSPTTAGGWVQTLFWGRGTDFVRILSSDNLGEHFKNYILRGASFSFGNMLGTVSRKQLIGLWGNNLSPYKSEEEFMKKVGAFAMPTWGINPQNERENHPFDKSEISQRKQGKKAYVNDTAKASLWRAAYNCPDFRSPFVEQWFKKHFEDKADYLVKTFQMNQSPDKRVSEKEIREHLIIKFDYDEDEDIAQGIRSWSWNSNPFNNPFGDKTPEEMSRIFNIIGVTPEAINIYFGNVRAESQLATKAGLKYESYEILSDEEKIARTKAQVGLLETDRYDFNNVGTVATEVLDNINPPGLTAEERRTIQDMKDMIKEILSQKIGGDTIEHIKVYKDIASFYSAVSSIVDTIVELDPDVSNAGQQILDAINYGVIALSNAQQAAKDELDASEKRRELLSRERALENIEEDFEKSTKDIDEETQKESIDESEPQSEPQSEVSEPRSIIRRRPKDIQAKEKMKLFESLVQVLQNSFDIGSIDLDREIDDADDFKVSDDLRTKRTNYQHYIKLLGDAKLENIKGDANFNFIEQELLYAVRHPLSELLDSFTDEQYKIKLDAINSNFGLKTASIRNRKKLAVWGTLATITGARARQSFEEDDRFYRF